MVNQHKRAIILREIEHWRRNKLLPEHYCDFLKNLYADETAVTSNTSSGRLSVTQLKRTMYILTAISAFSIICFNFTLFSLPFQIFLISVGLFALYAFGVSQREKSVTICYSMLGIAALGTLLSGPLMLQAHGVEDKSWIGVYIAACGVLWILLGVLLRIGMLHVCGWLACSLVHAWIIYQYADDWAWWMYQLMWIALAVLFGSGYIISRKKDMTLSLVFILVAAVQWLIPDLLTWLLFGTSVVFQFLFVLKLALGGGLYGVARRLS